MEGGESVAVVAAVCVVGSGAVVLVYAVVVGRLDCKLLVGENGDERGWGLGAYLSRASSSSAAARTRIESLRWQRRGFCGAPSTGIWGVDIVSGGVRAYLDARRHRGATRQRGR